MSEMLPQNVAKSPGFTEDLEAWLKLQNMAIDPMSSWNLHTKARFQTEEVSKCI